MNRYSRQMLFAGVGRDGQERLGRARVAVVGCGALGSALAETMARAGVGALTVIDRDLVEESNLQRQSLFAEEDVAEGRAKAAAAERRLRAVNSTVEVRGVVADLSGDNADALLDGADLVLDGTDNFETRFLLNDVCLRARRPWIYGAVVGSYGLALLVRPGLTPCLRCLLEEMPPAGSGPTCDTAGVVMPAVQMVAAVQSAEALKLLAGRADDLLAGLVTLDAWHGRFDVMDLSGRAPWCPACTEGRYDYVTAGSSAVLCGRDAVQVRPASRGALDLESLAARLRPLGEVRQGEQLVRFHSGEADLIVFSDGRAIVKGVQDLAQARSVYARYVGL